MNPIQRRSGRASGRVRPRRVAGRVCRRLVAWAGPGRFAPFVTGLGLAAVAVGIALRVHRSTPLWLDEALSVDIASLDVPQLLAALRQDGSPPLYYLLLHVWMAVFGTGNDAVRSLSTLASLLTLPLASALARALGGPRAGWIALALVAVNPFLIRYGTETRMYALLAALLLLGALLAVRAWARPTLGRLWPVSLLAGAAALTHYWAIFVVAAFVLLMVGLAVGRPEFRARSWRLAAAAAAGAVLFLPWLPTFLFQVRHTGTPWAPAPTWSDLVLTARDWSGGTRWFSEPLAAGLVVAFLLGATPRRSRSRVDSGRPAGAAAGLGSVAAAALLMGLAVSALAGSGYATRYSAPLLGLVLVVAAVGVVTRLPPLPALVALVLLTAGSAVIATHDALIDRRTQAGDTAALLAAAGPSDLVVYCPDQLGPAVSRVLAQQGTAVRQVVYPTLGAPERVDWVDYAARNAAADPVAVAGTLTTMTSGRIWLVLGHHYLTFGDSCQRLASALAAARGPATARQTADLLDFENEDLLVYPRATG